jgi:CBS domain-containing protein
MRDAHARERRAWQCRLLAIGRVSCHSLRQERRVGAMNIAQLIAGRAGLEIVTCDGHVPMREALRLLAQKRIGAIPVMQQGRVVGIFSERDVIYCLEREGEASLDKPVAEVMTAPAISVDQGTRIDDALALMTRRRIRHLPVMDGERMCGFISIGDLVKSRIDAVQAEAEAMRVYIQTA